MHRPKRIRRLADTEKLKPGTPVTVRADNFDDFRVCILSSNKAINRNLRVLS